MIIRKEDDVVYYDSSNILFSTYDSSKKNLYICFKNGQTYVYENIEQKLNEAFELAQSQGKFLSEKIKNKFSYVKDKKFTDFETQGVKSFIQKALKEKNK
jgi:hypothetical protein